jgi:hypothetical protein
MSAGGGGSISELSRLPLLLGLADPACIQSCPNRPDRESAGGKEHSELCPGVKWADQPNR